ncbi:MAG: phosphate ABC transporter substrate-binding protein [Clostridia bacterium]|nr:phosphate ABC transporter substrate-binding protein [Clostridia bacterium]
MKTSKCKQSHKWIGVGLSLLLCAGMFTACGSSSETGDSTVNSEQPLSGTISMAGSTSMEKMANALREGFMAENSSVTVTAEFVGSSAGIESLLGDQCDIGNASRQLKDSEKEAGAVENVVAIDGIAVIVNNQDAVENLTKDQLAKIYTGEVKSWSEVGGPEASIVVIGREAGSGTRDAFEELLEIKDQCAYANELDSTGAVLAKVASTPGAIGYVSLDVLDNTVTAVSLDGVEPTEENIKAGDYFLSRPFVMATKGEISQQSELVQAWFAYIDSPEGQQILKQVGLISVK